MASSSTQKITQKMGEVQITDKLIEVETSDEQTFQIDESVAMQSQTIRHMVEDVGSNGIIPLPNISSEIFAMILEYCNRHAPYVKAAAQQECGSSSSSAAAPIIYDADLKAFDAEFVNVEQGTLFDIMLAANYLEIKSLLDLTCETVAAMCRGKSPDQIRAHFNIENDFTPEEYAEIVKKNGWAWGELPPAV